MKNRKYAIPVLHPTTILQSELEAIELALEIIRNTIEEKIEEINVFSDSSVSIKLIKQEYYPEDCHR